MGIPQGTAVSAVLANVYMIDFDEWLAKLCEKEGGLYRRYSDDFIIVLPQKQFSEESVKTFAMGVIQRSKTELGLKIESTKTKLYSYDQDNHSVMLYPIQETGKQRSGELTILDSFLMVFLFRCGQRAFTNLSIEEDERSASMSLLVDCMIR